MVILWYGTDIPPQEELIPYFGAANYSVFAAMLLISAAIGVYFWWKGQKSTEVIKKYLLDFSPCFYFRSS